MNPPLTVLRTYTSEDAALMDRLFLETSGIDSVLDADDCGGMTPYLQTLRGVRLLVREEDFERANDLLRSAEAAPNPGSDPV
ncbi:MAG: DUF2007 domain-containing protein [Kiritimatiellia bacterium]